VPLFDDPIPRRLLWPIEAPEPKRRAQRLLRRFRARFPQLVYDMDLAVELANAQALMLRGKRHVRLYGGLARHRRLGSAALALALAHETGHHLGGPPLHPYYRWLSSEARATEWALSVGLPDVFGEDAAEIGEQGLAELASIGLQIME
jgi:hypothetical protein